MFKLLENFLLNKIENINKKNIKLKIIGYKNATNLGEIIGKKFGHLFRSNYKIQKNLENSNIGNSKEDRKVIINNMWGNYGRIFAEYMYIKKYRENSFSNNSTSLSS